MKVELIPFMQKIHEKYNKLLSFEEAYGLNLSDTNNLFFWLDKQENYHIIRVLNDKKILQAPPISKDGYYLYSKAKNLLEVYNLPVILKKGNIVTTRNSIKMNSEYMCYEPIIKDCKINFKLISDKDKRKFDLISLF